MNPKTILMTMLNIDTNLGAQPNPAMGLSNP